MAHLIWLTSDKNYRCKGATYFSSIMLTTFGLDFSLQSLFSVFIRFSHLSFLLLGLSGLPLRFPQFPVPRRKIKNKKFSK